MDDEVDAPIDRILAVGRGEGVVDDRQRACLAGNRRDLPQIHDIEQGIGRRLDPDHPRVRSERGADGGEVAEIDEVGGDAVAGQVVGEEMIGAEVAVVADDGVIARGEQLQAPP